MKLPDAAILEKVRQWVAYADDDLGSHGMRCRCRELPLAG